MRAPVAEPSMRSRYGLGALAVVAAALVVIAFTNVALLGAIGVLFFFFVVMIGLHEFGHFTMARRAGMKVSEFFIGFGPRIWSTRRGDTEYGVKALPLGGYCKIIGMTNLDDVDPADEPRAFRNASFWGKATTLIAGPASHFVLAIILVWAVLAFDGLSRPVPTIHSVEKGTPAAVAGVRTGDKVVEIAGKPVHSWADLQHIVRPRPGASVTVIVDRSGTRRVLHATLMDNGGVGFLGVEPDFARQRFSPVAAAYHSPGKTFSIAKDAIGALGAMFSPSGISKYFDNFTTSNAPTSGHGANATTPTTAPNNNRFISPVGVGKIAYDAALRGWVVVFSLLISINIFVGLVNLVPLIPFDGGHLAVAAYEAVASRVRHRVVRADYAKLMPIAVATISVLAFIFLSSLFLDVTKPPQPF